MKIASQTPHGQSEPTSSNQTESDERIAQALEEYAAAFEIGQPLAKGELLARYAEIADELASCLDGLDFIHRVAPQVHQKGCTNGESAPALKPFASLGDFRLFREIGRGGMGVVYEAEQLSLGRKVALKVLPFAAMLDKQQLKRFKNEARAAAALDHSHIVTVYSVGEDRGVHYYAMQLIEGQSLAAIIHNLRRRTDANLLGEHRREWGNSSVCEAPTMEHRSFDVRGPDDVLGSLCPDQETNANIRAASSTVPICHSREYFHSIARLGIQAASALDCAHQNGVIHRDVKPANLLLDADGKLYVTDFGLARIESDAGMTMSGDLLGTLAYMSPEQALAKRVVVDHRTDIYSLGVTLYELLTLIPPHVGVDRQELLRKIAMEEPKRLRRLNRRVPQDLETIISRAMEKNAADRFPTAKDLADDLERFLLDRPISSRPPNLVHRAAKWARRHQGLVVSIVVILTLLTMTTTIGAVLIWSEKSRTQRALNDSREQQALAERRAAESEALVEFFTEDVLGSINPEKARGRQVTMEEVLTGAEQRIEVDLSEQPILEAAVRSAIGRLYMSLGKYEAAEQQLMQARDIQLPLLGMNAETLDTLSYLADAWRLQGNHQQAYETKSAVVEHSRRIHGQHHQKTIHAEVLLADTVRIAGDLERSRAMGEEALSHARKSLGADHEVSLAAMHILSLVYVDLRDFRRAKVLLQELSDGRRRTLGVDHPSYLNSNNHLIYAMIECGQREEALPLAEGNLATHRRVLGNDHEGTRGAMFVLIRLYRETGRIEDAIQLATEALERARSRLGETHSDTLSLVELLSLSYRENNQLADAEKLLVQTLALDNKIPADLARLKLKLEYELGMVYVVQNRLEEAKILFDSNVRRHESVFGKHYEGTAAARHQYGYVLYRLGEYEKAREESAKAIEGFDVAVGPTNVETLIASDLHAGILSELRMFDEAIRVAVETLDSYRTLLGPNDPGTLGVMHNLGVIYEMAGDFTAAEETFRQTVDERRRVLGPDHRDTLLTTFHLAQTLGKASKHDQRRELLEELVERYRSAYGETNGQTLIAMNHLSAALKSLERFDEAIAIENEAIDILQRSAPRSDYTLLMHQSHLATIYRKKGDKQTALKINNAVGITAFDAEHWQLAVTSFARALEDSTDPKERGSANLHIAICKAHLDNMKSARQAYAAAVEALDGLEIDEELRRLRSEAAELLAIDDQ